MVARLRKTINSLRALLWPIANHELGRFVPMFLIAFLITFNYNLLRVLKDSLVVTAKHSGAEVIPFIKVWVMFPSALLMTYIYTKLSNRVSQQTVFCTIISLFLGYFALFVFVLYPHQDTIHPHDFCDRLQMLLPEGFIWMIAMLRHWSFTLFYVMSELWSPIVMFLLYWGFVNQVTKVHEAKRFYTLFSLGANFSGIWAGTISGYFSRNPLKTTFLAAGKDEWSQSLTLLIVLILIFGFLTLALFAYLQKHIDQKMLFCHKKVKVDKTSKLSMRKHFFYLLHNPYARNLAIIVLAYNLIINLVEVVWKHEVRDLYPTPAAYNAYMSDVTTFIGIIATLSAIFLSGQTIRKKGWTFAAMITPVILLLTSIGFFGSFFLKDELANYSDILLEMQPLTIVVFFGTVQNVLSRAAKYSVFDTTKEMAFVPLSVENQMKSKAAIEGVCSRMGKSSGSVIHQGLLLTFASLTTCVPYVAFFLGLALAVWFFAVLRIGKYFQVLSDEKEGHLKAKAQHPNEKDGFVLNTLATPISGT